MDRPTASGAARGEFRAARGAQLCYASARPLGRAFHGAPGPPLVGFLACVSGGAAASRATPAPTAVHVRATRGGWAGSSRLRGFSALQRFVRGVRRSPRAVPCSGSLTRASRAPQDNVESAIKDAKDECATGSTAECAAAWDVVEEVSAAQADAKAKAKARASPPASTPHAARPRGVDTSAAEQRALQRQRRPLRGQTTRFPGLSGPGLRGVGSASRSTRAGRPRWGPPPRTALHMRPRVKVHSRRCA